MWWWKAVRGIGAMVIGYAIIVALTTWGFDLVHGEGSLYGGGAATWALGSVVAVVAGLAGGLAAGWIGPWRGLANAALVLVPLVVDTTYVLFFFEDDAPWWFSLAGSLTLMGFTLAGGALRTAFK
jgi:hypothetical protein